jgi:RHS repeat-associated protein
LVNIYDVENRLVSASGASTAALRYDPLGRLYETIGSTSGTTGFLHDGDELVLEYNAAGTVLRRYVHGAGVDDPLIWYEGAAATPAEYRRLRTDHQGSVIGINNQQLSLTAIRTYDEWGIPKSVGINPQTGVTTALTQIGRFGYTGQAWLPELGMYYYKARIYSPTLDRFLHTDPIGYDDGLNASAYVRKIR